MQDNPLQRDLTDNNERTRGYWAEFAGHREQIRKLLDAHCRLAYKSICILGAGNTNDLDLPWLTDRFSRVVLVDLDESAMVQGVQRQLGVGDRSNPPQLVRVDVTGVYEQLGSSSHTHHERGFESVFEQLSRRPVPTPLNERFDCVVSACLLSQLIGAIKTAVGEAHPQFVPLVLAVRAQHLALAAQMTSPAGLTMIVTDFVSSLTCPELAHLGEAELAAYAEAQIARQNFFTGLNPQLLTKAAQAEWKGRCSDPLRTAPWKWNLGTRSYLVAAVLGALS